MQSLSGQALRDLLSGRAVQLPPKTREAITAKEHAANRRGVEILVRFAGLTERAALEQYSEYFVQANRSREGRNIMMPAGHPMACTQLRELWNSFGQPPPPCETADAPDPITTCPYDDWMSTGCKTGEPILTAPVWDTGI